MPPDPTHKTTAILMGFLVGFAPIPLDGPIAAAPSPPRPCLPTMLAQQTLALPSQAPLDPFLDTKRFDQPPPAVPLREEPAEDSSDEFSAAVRTQVVCYVVRRELTLPLSLNDHQPQTQIPRTVFEDVAEHTLRQHRFVSSRL